MEDIYEAIMNRLDTEVPELNWIDMDKGQLDFEDRPSVNFPCALISLQYPRSEDRNVSGTKQKVGATINVRVGYDFSGQTSMATAQAEREKSRAFMRLAQKVFEKLQGWHDGTFTRLSRTSMREERRADAYKVTNIIFATGFDEDINA